MAIPTSMLAATRVFPSGIIVGINPSTGRPFDVDLQQSTVNSTASSVWTSIRVNPQGSTFRYTASLGQSTRTYYFRARHTGLGYTDGAFTNVVSAKPALLPQAFRPIMPQRNSVGNVEVLGGDIWISSAKTAKVGTQQTTGKITRQLRVAAGQFLPVSTGLRWINGGSYVGPSSTATLTVVGAVTLPAGIVLTGSRARFFKGTAADSLVWQFVRTTGGGLGTILSSGAATSTGWANSSAAFSHTVTTANSYYAYIVLNPSTNFANAKLGYFEVSYTRGRYDVVY